METKVIFCNQEMIEIEKLKIKENYKFIIDKYFDEAGNRICILISKGKEYIPISTAEAIEDVYNIVSELKLKEDEFIITYEENFDTPTIITNQGLRIYMKNNHTMMLFYNDVGFSREVFPRLTII